MRYHDYRLAVQKKFYTGARIYIASGPARGQWRTIKAVETRLGFYVRKKFHPNQPSTFFVFDKPLESDKPFKVAGSNKHLTGGVYVHAPDPYNGTSGMAGKSYGVSDNYTRVHDDLPPKSKGKTCLRMSPGQVAAYQVKGHSGGFGRREAIVHSMEHMDCNRKYKFSFWGKAAEKDAKLVISFVEKMAPRTIALSPEWKYYEEEFDFTGKFPGKYPSKEWVGVVRPALNAAGGDVLVDDIKFEGLGYTNKTAWVDEVFESLKFAKLGGIRITAGIHSAHFDHHGMPASLTGLRLDAKKSGANKNAASQTLLSQRAVFQLAEELGVDASYEFTHFVTRDEIDDFMEYIGAPADVGAGKIRAAEGHPEPWLDTLSAIHVNFVGTATDFFKGDGRDFWNDLAGRAKKSPYYKPNLFFGVRADNPYVGKGNMRQMVVDDMPNIDRLMSDCGVGRKAGGRFPPNIWEHSPAVRAWYALGIGYRSSRGKVVKDFAIPRKAGVGIMLATATQGFTAIWALSESE